VSREKRRGADVRASRSSACVDARARGAHATLPEAFSRTERKTRDSVRVLFQP
jgi:hypothetical protein